MHPIGIDLGTTYSAISKWAAKKGFTGSETYYLSRENGETLASKVYGEVEDGMVSFMVGKGALQRGINNPDNAIWAVKREMDNADHEYVIEGHSLNPIEVSAEIVKALLREVEAIEKPDSYVPKGVVVTVPYYFKQHQNINTKQAVLKALKDLYADRESNPENLFLGLVAEPIAAGLDFAFNHQGQNLTNQNFLIFDLGGGTFDLTIFRLDQRNNKIDFQVLAVAGDDRLGGEDFDEALSEGIWQEIGFDIHSLDNKAKNRVLKKVMPEITCTKEILSGTKSASLIVPSQAAGMPDIDLEIRKKDFEHYIQGAKVDNLTNYASKVELLVDSVLHKASLKSSDIQGVLLTGGSSGIPFFQEMLTNKFGEAQVRQQAKMNLAVSRGAAIYAAYLLDQRSEGNGKQYLSIWDSVSISEPTAHSIGIRLSKVPFYTVIKDNQITPASKTLPITPSRFSEDGSKIAWDEIIVLQGDKDSVVGRITIPEPLYTHGRNKAQIKGKLTFKVNRNLIVIQLFMPAARADQSDFQMEEELTF